MLTIKSHLHHIKEFTTSTNVLVIMKYRSFPYRLLQHTNTTNIHLAKHKIKYSKTCPFCNDTKETYLHLFIFYSHVYDLDEVTILYELV